MPSNLVPEAYELVYELFERIDSLTPSHLTALSAVLKMGEESIRP